MVEVGCVHGRFQPFHNEHLEYVLAAKEKCNFLWIGITKYNRKQQANEKSTSAHRETITSNPYTYAERVTMIRDSLINQGIDRSEFDFVPFPIENTNCICEFIAPSVICYTTIRDKWNLKKINLLKNAGYKVEVLWENYSEKKFSGSVIRPLIVAGDVSWKNMVPVQVATIIESSLNHKSNKFIQGTN